ncbi:MAG: dihydrodipicolinate synthase family protein, partial [Campylobacteraceae bacterium]|nr:dihydrodipicolinate synthase family protein [Campylobacteraceae bacterium]
GKGVISVTANLLPDKISELTHKALESDYLGAKAINDELYAINKALFCESNPIPIKAAMYIAGLLDSLEYRLPLVPPNDEHFKFIEQTMKKYTIRGLE